MTIEYLDPEIANEGQRADMMPGVVDDDGAFQPMVEKPHIPTYEGIKSIKHLFPQFSNVPYRHKAFPAIFYHATEKPRLVRTPEAAAALGVTWNKGEHRFDCAGEWKAKPVVAPKPAHDGPGKSLMEAQQTRAQGQSELIGAVVAAVIAQMKNAPAAAPTAAAQIAADPDYAEFLAFKAWKNGERAPIAAATMDVAPAVQLASDNPNKLTEAEEREVLLEAAAERDIPVDDAWSLDRIKEALDEVA
ncbi:MAG TPA: hypothetical protein VKX28_26880 [Xanthobacteraceae bacterium]|nr:hypothetical protein [Xanthobacteraceae bacterium]